jgi:MscS family membrane protein
MFEQWDWNTTLWAIPLTNLLLATTIFLVILLFRTLFARIVLKQIRKFVRQTESTLDDKIFTALEAPFKLIFIVLGFYVAMLVLNLSAEMDAIVTPFVRSLIILTVFWALYRCIEPFTFLIENVTSIYGPELTQSLNNLFIQILKILLILIGLTIILYEWGINVLGLLTGFGIVGAAVAFAAKESLANIFGTLTIVFDKMFKPGDWIMTPDVEGHVEEIGSRATKVRTFAKALVTVPNATLVNSAVMNWSEMTNRRIKMRLHLDYRTSRDQITRILQRIKDYLHNHPEIETDPARVVTLVHLVEFNDSSIDILLYYFTKTIKWRPWMKIREENMLEFLKIVEQEGAAFAFPSQQIYLEQMPSDFPNALMR